MKRTLPADLPATLPHTKKSLASAMSYDDAMTRFMWSMPLLEWLLGVLNEVAPDADHTGPPTLAWLMRCTRHWHRIGHRDGWLIRDLYNAYKHVGGGFVRNRNPYFERAPRPDEITRAERLVVDAIRQIAAELPGSLRDDVLGTEPSATPASDASTPVASQHESALARESGTESAPTAAPRWFRDIIPQRAVLNRAIDAEFDGFRIVAQIGEGGYGEVYRARTADVPPQEVAIKILRHGLDRNDDVLARFAREHRLLSRLDGVQGIAKLLGAGRTPSERVYITMELVPGVPLQRYIASTRRTVRESVELMERICRIVGAAHAVGIVHRDLTPRNILIDDVTTTPTPWLLDFGLAAALTESSAKPGDDSFRTQVHVEIGTPAYRSPEHFGVVGAPVEGAPLFPDSRAIREPSDVYSLGLILWELFTGTPARCPDQMPLESEAEAVVMMTRLVRHHVEPPSERISAVRARRPSAAPTLPDPSELTGALDAITMRCLAHAPADRYRDANELANDLRAWLEHRRISTPIPGPLQRLGRRVHARVAGVRHLVTTSAIATTLSAAIVLTALLIFIPIGDGEGGVDETMRLIDVAESALRRVATLEPSDSLTDRANEVRSRVDTARRYLDDGRVPLAVATMSTETGRQSIVDLASAVDQATSASDSLCASRSSMLALEDFHATPVDALARAIEAGHQSASLDYDAGNFERSESLAQNVVTAVEGLETRLRDAIAWPIHIPHASASGPDAAAVMEGLQSVNHGAIELTDALERASGSEERAWLEPVAMALVAAQGRFEGVAERRQLAETARVHWQSAASSQLPPEPPARVAQRLETVRSQAARGESAFVNWDFDVATTEFESARRALEQLFEVPEIQLDLALLAAKERLRDGRCPEEAFSSAASYAARVPADDAGAIELAELRNTNALALTIIGALLDRYRSTPEDRELAARYARDAYLDTHRVTAGWLSQAVDARARVAQSALETLSRAVRTSRDPLPELERDALARKDDLDAASAWLEQTVNALKDSVNTLGIATLDHHLSEAERSLETGRIALDRAEQRPTDDRIVEAMSAVLAARTAAMKIREAVRDAQEQKPEADRAKDRLDTLLTAVGGKASLVHVQSLTEIKTRIDNGDDHFNRLEFASAAAEWDGAYRSLESIQSSLNLARKGVQLRVVPGSHAICPLLVKIGRDQPRQITKPTLVLLSGATAYQIAFREDVLIKISRPECGEDVLDLELHVPRLSEHERLVLEESPRVRNVPPRPIYLPGPWSIRVENLPQ